MSIWMFIIGFVIFSAYVVVLMTVVVGQHRIQREEHKEAYDLQDEDGVGNYGRVPAKKPKNRAL